MSTETRFVFSCLLALAVKHKLLTRVDDPLIIYVLLLDHFEHQWFYNRLYGSVNKQGVLPPHMAPHHPYAITWWYWRVNQLI